MREADVSQLPEYKEVPIEARLSYLVNFALDTHRDDMRFLLRTAKLQRKHNPETRTGWNNVMKHNVAQAVAMRLIATDIALPPEEVQRLERYAFLHNPTICRDVFNKKIAAGKKDIPAAESFTDDASETLDERYGELMTEVDYNGRLRVATSPDFFDSIAEQPGATILDKAARMPFSDLLVYYVDALFDDGNLLPAHERIGKMEERRPDLNADDERTARLGMRYWDAERAVSTFVQRTVWERLRANGIELAAPEDVPEYIRKNVGQVMLQHWDTINPPGNLATDVY